MNPFSAWTSTGAVPPQRGWSEQTQLSLIWGDHASPLQTRWMVLLQDLCRLGPQHVVTTNQVGALGFYAGLEWQHGDADGARLGCDGVEIDLDFQRVGAAFATGAPRAGVLPRATRVFDRHGDALLTFAANPFGPTDAFDAFARRNARPVAPPLPRVASPEPAVTAEAPSKAQLDAALSDWAELADARAFEALLDRHTLNRAQLYSAADDARASRIQARELVELLRWMVDQRAPMSLQVGRAGVVTVVRAIPEEVVVTRDGLEIGGGSAVLRLDPRRLDEAWLVTQTDGDGKRHRSIQLLDGAGELAVCLGGAEQNVAAGVSGWTRQPYRPGVSL